LSFVFVLNIIFYMYIIHTTIIIIIIEFDDGSD